MNSDLRQYAHARHNQLFPNLLEDFRHAVRGAPQELIASAIEAVFNSGPTDSFSEIVMDLFRHSDATLRAKLLNTLVKPVSESTLCALANAGLFGFVPNAKSVDNDTVSEIEPEALGPIAGEARRRDSRVLGDVSRLYSKHTNVLAKLPTPQVLTILTHIAIQAPKHLAIVWRSG